MWKGHLTCRVGPYFPPNLNAAIVHLYENTLLRSKFDRKHSGLRSNFLSSYFSFLAVFIRGSRQC